MKGWFNTENSLPGVMAKGWSLHTRLQLITWKKGFLMSDNNVLCSSTKKWKVFKGTLYPDLNIIQCMCILKHYMVSHKYIQCLCVNFNFQLLRAKEMTQRGLASKHEYLEFESPEPAWRKERSNSHKLSSLFHLYTMTYTCMLVCSHILNK